MRKKNRLQTFGEGKKRMERNLKGDHWVPFFFSMIWYSYLIRTMSQWRGRKPLPKEVTMKGKTWDTGRSKPHEGTASRPRKQCRRAQSKRMELPKEHRAKGGQGGRCAGHREPHEAGEGPWTSSRRLRGAFEEFPGDLDQSNVVK